MKSISTVCLGLVLAAWLLTPSNAATSGSSDSPDISSEPNPSSERVDGAEGDSRPRADSSKQSRKEPDQDSAGAKLKIKSPQIVPAKDRKVEDPGPEAESNVDYESQPAAEEVRADPTSKLMIGATAVVIEAQSKLAFLARVDTGAASCSIHCEEWEISDEQEEMKDNIGREIRVRINNGQDGAEWVDSRIDRCVTVKTSEKKETRYKVPLTLLWGEFEKQVVVTLNNRGHMNYPLLLGRNFLESDFVVDIGLDETQ